MRLYSNINVDIYYMARTKSTSKATLKTSVPATESQVTDAVPQESAVEQAVAQEAVAQEAVTQEAVAQEAAVQDTIGLQKSQPDAKASGMTRKYTKKLKGGSIPKEQLETKAKSEKTEETQQDSKVSIPRSFKVKLPARDTFEGRFTGLTPYQAANKALSKFFRDNKDYTDEITFSICESTRNSNKHIHTYVGKRIELDTPVVYNIKGGREICKRFKNSLRKIKKSEDAEA